MGAATYIKRALAAIDVISIGVMSGNNNVLKLEHLYHFVGDKDLVERVVPSCFPSGGKSFVLLNQGSVEEN